MAVKKKLSDLPVLRHYDKILVVLALVILLVSLAYLITAGLDREKDESKFVQLINNLKPTSAPVAAIAMGAFEAASKDLGSPFAISSIDRTKANFLTPELRVTCMACQRPIPDQAKTCPFCGGKQEGVQIAADHCTVGEVPDRVKRDLGLPINDESVEFADADNDGFSLREEYHAGTDPKDPKSHPPYSTKLQLKEFQGKKLPLVFTTVNKMPDGNMMTFSWSGPVPRPRSFFIRENQPIADGNEKTGFTAGALNIKFEERDGPAGPVRVDVSTVVLTRDSDGKKIEVRVGEKEKNTDVEAILVFLVDNSELTLLEKQEFKLRDETYRVVSVNEKDGVVVVEDAGTGAKESVTMEVKTFKKELKKES
ncbi:MAG: thrombospondin type 3 repeat-containing protein [Kiritimatiellaeota bacterium]|nr:thrombospondin type 3 repeat-containing protein [Kiritimatiellota bacterium]